MKNKTIVIGIIIVVLIQMPLFSVTAQNQTTLPMSDESTTSFESLLKEETLLEFESPCLASAHSLEGLLDENEIVPQAHEHSIIKDVHFSLAQCHLYTIDEKRSYVGIEGLGTYGSPGAPMIPMEPVTITLPKTAHLSTVGMTQVYYQKVKTPLCLVPNPEPVFWTEEMTPSVDIKETLIPDMTIYNSDQYYPGTTLSYMEGKNTKETQVFVHLFPVQYNPKHSTVFVLTQGVLQVVYSLEEETPSEPIFTTDAENIIVTPPSLYEEAMNLKLFHDTRGTSTMVVNTTWIDETYEEAEDPPYSGYSDPTLPDYETIHDYEYGLAKKIISFLADEAAHMDLQYVTVLGNARLVPPSYYVYYRGIWVPTDFCYASPDGDMLPNYQIGRLPADSDIEAAQVINKIITWDATTELFETVAVAGGKPFGSPYDIGELITIDALDKEVFQGICPTKYYRTEDTFDRDNILTALSGGTGLLYHIGHGSGTAWALEGNPIDVDDLNNLPPSISSPVIVSIACMNGAFDTHLVNMGFTVSFAEAVLLSDAGGICYIGGSRSNAGVPVFTMDNGLLTIFNELYMADMLTSLMEAYRDGATTLGGLTASAMNAYVAEHDFSDEVDSYTFFAFVLLGDPALALPSRPTATAYDTPASQVDNKLGSIDATTIEKELFTYGNGNIPIGVINENLTVSSTTNSPMVTFKLVDAFKQSNMVINRTTLPTVQNSATYEFSTSEGSTFSLRAITDDGKESWLYTTVVDALVDDDFDASSPGWHEIRWKSIQNALDAASYNDLIYVFSGTYEEPILLSHGIQLYGEAAETTLLDAGGDGSVVTIQGTNCCLAGFTITQSGNEVTDAGVLIEGYQAFVSTNTIRETTIGISAVNAKTPVIRYNAIVDNTQGLYLETEQCVVYSNNIEENEVGVYLKEGNSNILWANEINGNDHGVHAEALVDSWIWCNNITGSTQGLILESCTETSMMMNNFVDNRRHARFIKGENNVWMTNYWDNWIGLRFNIDLPFPKIIVGRTGDLLSLMPWINLDFQPAHELNTVEIPY
jgi:parallel beta-helix repeat protein